MRHFLFPTVIWQGNRQVSDEEKSLWFESYLVNSDSDGASLDYLGFQSHHLDSNFSNIFKDIIQNVKYYFDELSIDHTKLNLYITKTWYNAKTTTGNPQHCHGENHISFTYYPHINPQFEKNLAFFREYETTPNEPYFGFLEDIVTEWTPANCRSYQIPISEGDIVVFPSKLFHSTNGEGTSHEYFKTKEELVKSRFCVGGDIIITRKDTKEYEKLLPPIENWKLF